MSQAGLIDIEGSHPQIPTQFDANVGSAVPIGNVLEILGINGITTSASGNTVEIDGSGLGANLTITGQSGGPLSPTLNNWNLFGSGNIGTSGSGSTLTTSLTGLTPHSVQIGALDGASLTQIPVGTNGQVLLGATGADPQFATLTSTGGTIDFTTGANTLNLEASSSTALQFDTDSGSAVPAANILTISGGTGLNSAGAGSTVTINLDSPVIVANGGTGTTSLTDHAVLIGSGTGAITPVGPVAATGALLASNGVGSDPGFTTATYPLTTTANEILYSSSTNTVTGLATANNGTMITGATGIPSWLANGTTGQVLTATTGSPPSWAAAAGDVTSSASLTDNAIVRGDGGAKGVQTSGVIIDDSNNVTGVASIVINSGSTLDVYQEGTFSPTIYVGGSTTGVTYSVQTGYYVIIGNFCWITGSITVSSLGGLTGVITVRNFPATGSFLGSNPIWCFMNAAITLPGGRTGLYILPSNGTAQGQLRAQGSGTSSAQMTHTELTSSGSFSFSGFYHTT